MMVPMLVETEEAVSPEAVTPPRTRRSRAVSMKPLVLGACGVAGAVVVWVVDPISRNVLEHRQGAAVVTIDEAGTLTAPDVIPGFALPVADVLRE